MAKPTSRRNWRVFYDRLLKEGEYQISFDAEKYGAYKTYREVFIQIDRILKRYPQRLEPVSIGKSAGGEAIWAFRVDNTREETEPPVRFLITSLLHPLEFIGAEITLTLMERFAANMKLNPTLQNREVVFLPILNPDGYRRVEKDLAAGRSRFRRFNRNGVDLNRNFSAFFSRRAPIFGALRFLYNPGPRPFSEPETAAYRSLLLEHRFDFAASFHSFGGRFFWPYAAKRESCRHDSWFRDTVRAMIDLQPRCGFRAKQLGRWFPLFRARGTEMDYLYEVYGTRAITIEAFRRGPSILNPAAWRDPFTLFNPKNPEREVENLMDPLFHFLASSG
ncbi:MAG: hypothetical protein JW958_02985 [Candidatus Eisenbacteria bacterium]|nr:hypothetical protein [Candidatus Eisenbacteria bacterium]